MDLAYHEAAEGNELGEAQIYTQTEAETIFLSLPMHIARMLLKQSILMPDFCSTVLLYCSADLKANFLYHLLTVYCI